MVRAGSARSLAGTSAEEVFELGKGPVTSRNRKHSELDRNVVPWRM
jgi:hypothetical protein